MEVRHDGQPPTKRHQKADDGDELRDAGLQIETQSAGNDQRRNITARSDAQPRIPGGENLGKLAKLLEPKWLEPEKDNEKL